MNHTKYGVIFYPQTDNLGDHIQTYAAACRLPHVDYVIDRENMDLFESNDHEPVSVLMNGWYMHNKANFIPSRDINPLCLSMHFSKYDYFEIGYDFLDGEGGKWLKRHEPIGCRDEASVTACEERGIKAYFSGCMTLTLPTPPKTEDRGSYLCAVDLGPEEEASVKQLAGKIPVISVTHTIKEQGAAEFQSAMQLAEEHLRLYANAKCVFTSRLHCALPCLAMGVPVVLVNDAKKDDPLRFSSFIQLLRVVSPDALRLGDLPFDPLHPSPNPTQYLRIREDLIARVDAMVQNGANAAQMRAKNSDVVRQRLWQRALNDRIIQTASQRIIRLTDANREQQNWIETLKTENAEILQKNQELERWAETSKQQTEDLLQKNQELERWAETSKQQTEDLLQKNQELERWAETSKQQTEDLLEKNRELECWAQDNKRQMEALMQKNQELFDWAKSLEARLEKDDKGETV